MQQKTFLSLAAAIALAVGTVAVLFPAALLASKGTLPSAAADLWMREVGVLLVQLGLLVTEVLGYASGVITQLSGLVPNAVLHVVLAAGFAYYWRRGGRADPL